MVGERSYKEALEIDYHSLDENWKNHAVDYMHWSEKWANAVAERDRLKEKLDVTSAEEEKNIRMSFARNPPIGMKVTEGLISAELTLSIKVRALKDKLIQINEDINNYASAKSAFEARKKALEGLTSLWIGGYYNLNPSTDLKEIVQKANTESHKKEVQKSGDRLKKIVGRRIKNAG